MAIKDSRAYQTASRGYNTAMKSGSEIYKASKPYRSTGKSIIAAAKGNLFEFPVFISSSVQLDYATATSSLLEQVYASYVQTALSLNPVIDKTQIDNGTPFAKFQSDTNRYVEYTEMDYAHEAVHNEFEMEDGSFIEFDMISIEDADGKVILEYYDKRPLSEFDHYFQEAAQRPGPNASNDDWADYLDDLQADLATRGARLKDQEQKIKEKQDEITKRERNMASENKLRSLGEGLKADKDALKEEKKRLEGQKRALENEKKQFDLDKKEYEETLRHNKAEEEHKRKQLRHQIVKDRHDQKQHEKDWERELNFKYAVKAPEMLDETKIKKLNTMKPLMMNVSFHVAADDGHISQAINYIVGVKTFNRIIDADTLPEVVEYPLKEMNKIARKAKWRAGELKFFRDIVFKIKQKKQTAVDSKDPKRKWYRRLYELAHMTGDAPAKAAIKGKNVAWSVVKSQIEQDFDYGIIPNASLIISASDVSNVKAKTGIDLLKGSSAKKLCKELFLIALVVIDTDAESIKILMPDNHDDYEVHSLASVNKQLAELSTAGSKTRDIFKLLG